MQVHGSRDGDIGDRHVVSDNPFGIRQTCIEDAGEPVPVWCFLVDSRLVRLGIQKWLDDMCDEINVAAREPG